MTSAPQFIASTGCPVPPVAASPSVGVNVSSRPLTCPCERLIGERPVSGNIAWSDVGGTRLDGPTAVDECIPPLHEVTRIDSSAANPSRHRPSIDFFIFPPAKQHTSELHDRRGTGAAPDSDRQPG